MLGVVLDTVLCCLAALPFVFWLRSLAFPCVVKDCGGYCPLLRSVYTIGFYRWFFLSMLPRCFRRTRVVRVGDALPRKACVVNVDASPGAHPLSVVDLQRPGRPLLLAFGSWT